MPGGDVLLKAPGGYPLREINPGPPLRRCGGWLQVWSSTDPGGDPLPSLSCRPEGNGALFVYGFEHFRIFRVGGGSGRQREEV